MSIIKITRDNLENLTVTTSPYRLFSSSSTVGVTGSVFVYAERTNREKGFFNLESLEEVDSFDEAKLAVAFDQFNEATLKMRLKADPTDLQGVAGSLLNLYNATDTPEYRLTEKEITRFVPGVPFNSPYGEKKGSLHSGSLKKSTVKKVLFPYYRTAYPSAHWAYTNFNCLNFFTSSMVPKESVIIYPSSGSQRTGHVPYMPDGEFTFQFWINPRYTFDRHGDDFQAGTVMHMSGCYAVSLVSGSQKDSKGLTDAYRIMLQLSASTTIPPSSATYAANNSRNYGEGERTSRDLLFLTSDNILKRNKWHHVAIRWGTNSINQGTGSFVIDGVEDSQFYVPSASVTSATWGEDTMGGNFPGALFIGNFFEGSNKGAANYLTTNFFNSKAGSEEGVKQLSSDTGMAQPEGYALNHPLNAEIHDIRIYDKWKNVDQIYSSSLRGISSSSIKDKNLLFYLPPFFVKESGGSRQVPDTPCVNKTGHITESPFNARMAFSVAGHDINLENFCREFKEGLYPRLFKLTGSIQTALSEDFFPNEYFYDDGGTGANPRPISAFNRRRALTLMPCDNGKFRSDFTLLDSGTIVNNPATGSLMGSFVNDFEILDNSLISLNNIVPDNDFLGSYEDNGASSTYATEKLDVNISMLDDLAGASAFNYRDGSGTTIKGATTGKGQFRILEETGDNSSNQVVFFNVSNLFYGDRIRPGTFKLSDSDISGSGGKVAVTLKDDGQGGLYRADSLTKHATWNNVGNILYDEGIIVIKSPHLYFFGANQYEVEFRGERNMHALALNISCPAGMINSSTNPTYSDMVPSDNEWEKSEKFVYITGLNLHDDNFNIIGKVNLAQPVIKRDSDRYMFKVKFDF